MESISAEQFLLTCINNSDLTKVDYVKVAKECSISTGAAKKRYSRWKTKIQAELAKGPTTATERDGDGETEDGSASPKKRKKTPAKEAAMADSKEATPKKTPAKKTPAKKNPAKKRKLEKDADDATDGAVKDEPKEDAEGES